MGVLEKPPPLKPFQEAAFRSKLRVERIVVRAGIPLALCITICFLTGLFSHFQQHPVAWLPIPPAPVGLYRVTQGLHVATGIAAIPLLAIKLWAVYPNLFTWPLVKSFTNAIERLLIFVLVAAMLFQTTTGVINITQWYPWKFGFTQTHFAMAFVVVGALLLHLAFKAPGIVRALRKPVPHDPPPVDAQTGEVKTHIDNNAAYSAKEELVTGGISRRGLFIAAAASAGALTLVTVGQTVNPLKDIALLAPRIPDIGPQGIPVNKTFVRSGITPAMVSSQYRLRILGPTPISLTLEDLNRLQQVQRELPIACVEGWSASALWSGIQMSTLLDMAGIDPAATIRVTSLETQGDYGVSELQPQFARDPLTLLALSINDEPLNLDHGYPARIMAPNRPGVLQTKWVTQLEAI